MKPIIIRTITGSIFVALVIFSILAGHFFFAGLFILIGLLGIFEFYRIISNESSSPQKLNGVITAAIFYITVILYHYGLITKSFLLFNIITSAAMFIYELYRKKAQPFTNLACTYLGIIYIITPLLLLNMMFQTGNTSNSFNPHILLGFFIIIWTSDTFAYLAGMAFGKHKLFERISPKKTWEGSIGGAIAGIIAALVLSFFFNEYKLLTWVAIAIIIIVFGTLGDLAESLLKRTYNIKDSGSILPGHGGILDRIDGVLIAAPILYIFINLIK